MNEYERKYNSDLYPKYLKPNPKHTETSAEGAIKHKGLIIKTVICVIITAACFLLNNYETAQTIKINDGMKYLLSYNIDYKPILQNVRAGFLKLPAIFTVQNDAEEEKPTLTDTDSENDDNNAGQE